MTIPTLDPQYPLRAAPLPSDRLLSSGADATPLLLALVKQAFHLVRSAEGWRKGKQFGDAAANKGGKVQALSCPSDMPERLGKCAWHARLSQHEPREAGLNFDDFYDGLGSEQHTPNEGQYVHEITETKKIAALLPGRAEVWRNSYKLSRPTANRDFLELVVTLPLPPSPAPFSQAHEEVTQQLLSATPSQLPAHPAVPGAQGRRSFLVISIPVEHPDAPERPKEYVRAKYASVEAVWEGQSHDKHAEATGKTDTSQASSTSPADPSIEWFMAVQSDASGSIPLIFQELAMPGKIAQDVPLFFDWAHKKKASGGRVLASEGQ